MEESPENGKFHLLSETSSSQQYGGSAVSDLGRVTCCCGPILLESRLELAEALKGGFLPDAVILRHDDGLCFVAVLDRRFDWNDLIIEQALLLGKCSLSMAFHGESVLISSGDSVFLGHVFGSLPHPHQAVPGYWVLEDRLIKQLGVDLVLHVEQRHLLNSSANADVQHAVPNFGGDDSASFYS